MPKELRGVWCGTAQENIYRRCREADSEDNLGISVRKFYVAEGILLSLPPHCRRVPGS